MGVRGDAFTKPSVYHLASVVHIFFPITVSRSYMVTFMFMPIQTMHINVLYSGSVVTTAFCDEEDMLKAIYTFKHLKCKGLLLHIYRTTLN